MNLKNDHLEFDKDKVIPSEIIELDQYVEKGFYGIELYQRLFWHAYVLNQNIERQEDTATGRASIPGFQDANLKTLKTATDAKPKPSPMPVVFQVSLSLVSPPSIFIYSFYVFYHLLICCHSAVLRHCQCFSTTNRTP